MEPKDNNPYHFIQHTSADLSFIKEQLGSAIDAVDQMMQMVNTICPYWTQVNPATLQSNATGGTAVGTLQNFQQQVSSFRSNLETPLNSIPYLRSSAIMLGTLTTSAHHFVSPVPQFEPTSVNTLVLQYSDDELYARKFEQWDSTLGRIYRQALQVLSRTTSYPERSALPDIRQAFDYLLSKLVPNEDDVRKQAWWPEYGKHEDASKVSTRQKLKYAAEKHAISPNMAQTIINATTNILSVYRDLNSFHAKGNEQFNEVRAKAAIRQMLAILNTWADALGL